MKRYDTDLTHSNYNQTFIVLNLPLMKGDSKVQQHQHRQPISVSRDRKEAKHNRECHWMTKTRVGMPWCTGFKLLSERGYGGGCVNLTRKSIPNSGSIKFATEKL